MLERIGNARNEVSFYCIEDLVPKEHLLRKIEKAVDFNEIYPMVEPYYCQDNGRPAADPVVLVKIVMIWHLFGLRSLRQTLKEIKVNLAYRWFLGFGVDTPVPHFATVSYAFATRFPSELSEKIFAWILDAAATKGFIKAETVFIDGTHIKASANKKKKRKELAAVTARVYGEQLRKEIDKDRAAHGKKPLKDKDDDDKSSPTKEVTVSTTDPDSGVFRKGEHEVQFAYEAHTASDKHGFILGYDVTAGNVHDSIAFDKGNPKVCVSCPSRNQCTESKNCQKVVTRHIWEHWVEKADDFRHTPEGKASYAKRKETIERVFADAKEKHAMRYTHMRGLTRVRSWVGLKFAAMNLKKMALWVAKQPFSSPIHLFFRNLELFEPLAV